MKRRMIGKEGDNSMSFISTSDAWFITKTVVEAVTKFNVVFARTQ